MKAKTRAKSVPKLQMQVWTFLGDKSQMQPNPPSSA